MKKFLQKKNTPFFLMIIGISTMVVLIVASGILGIFSIFSTTGRYREHIEAIDAARQAQLELDKQYHTWKTLMLEGNDFTIYKQKYHEYSYHLVHTSDLLFNLALMLSGKPIEYEIEQLRDLHSSLSKEYLQTLLDSQTSQVEERKRIVHLFHIKEQTILQKMNAIVEQIRDKSAQESDQLIDFYLKLTASSIVMLAVAAILMGLFIGNLVLRTHTYLQLKIERRTRDIQNANQLLAQSERRYRQIIESTSDIIITLNSNFVITSANTAVKKIFGINANDLIGNNFIDLIYEGSDGRGMSKKIILEKITDFLTEKNSVNFIADFCMPTILEPKTLHVQLEHIESEAQIEILGRGTPVANANLAKFLSYERLSLIADNYLSDANEISFRLTNMLIKYLEPSEITLIRIGLREMIINAIEHGNLEITFEEKTRALAENNYFELLAKRRNEAPFANRKVRIDSIINSAKAIFRITDDGKGFDVNAYLSKKEIEHTLSHGRGITMAMQVFDEVRYNNKGNQVLLIKYLDKNKPQQISGKGLSHCHPVLPV